MTDELLECAVILLANLGRVFMEVDDKKVAGKAGSNEL